MWCWDNLDIQLTPELADFAAEGIWSLLKRHGHFCAVDLDGLVRIVKRKLNKIQRRPRLIDGCLAGTGLKLESGDHMRYEFNLGRRWSARYPQHVERVCVDHLLVRHSGAPPGPRLLSLGPCHEAHIDDVES